MAIGLMVPIRFYHRDFLVAGSSGRSAQLQAVSSLQRTESTKGESPVQQWSTAERCAPQSVRFLTYCVAVLDALAESAPQFMDVLVLTLFLMIIFGIMGIQVTAQQLPNRLMSCCASCSSVR